MSDLPEGLEPANPIHDPVHGRVWLTKLEMDIINTPEFQRLRSIGQLTPVDLVFPGATHNRFAHSIGAAHVMGMILKQDGIKTYFERTDKKELVPLLRLAALLHDVGHLPFSHVGEMAWNAFRKDPQLTALDAGETTVFDIASGSSAKPPLHETVSEGLILASDIGQIIDAELGEGAAARVASIVSGAYDDQVVRNLLSSDLDCDRLDYLLRDSMAAGLVYGNIDLAYLVGNLKVAEDEDGPTLAIDKEHGLVAGEHFLTARYFHYAQFIGHKTVGAAEVVLTAAMIELIRAGELPALSELLPDGKDPVQAVMGLTDGRVLTLMRAAAAGDPKTSHLVEASARLLQRRLPKTVGRQDRLVDTRRRDEGEAHPWDTMMSDTTRKRGFLAELDVEDPSRVCYRKGTLRLTGVPGDVRPSSAGDSALKKAVRKAAKVVDSRGKVALLIEASPLMNHLSHHQWETRRVFYRQDLDATEPSKDFERLREGLKR